MNFSGFFSFAFDAVCDLVLGSNGIYIPNGPREDGYPRREDRALYPPDGPVEILPPVNEKQAELKRKSADKEFWETM
jgi:hypothetical protein